MDTPGRADIVTLGDVRLETPSRTVEPDYDRERLTALLTATVVATPGAVGLAAVQIGEPVRAFLMWAQRPDSRDGTPRRQRAGSDHGPVVVYNPILELYGGTIEDSEGCLSVPGSRVWVERHQHATLVGSDTDGQPIRLELTGFEARVAQHETDHINGVLIVRRGTPITPTAD
jgi:peptide deformylase